MTEEEIKQAEEIIRQDRHEREQNCEADINAILKRNKCVIVLGSQSIDDSIVRAIISAMQVGIIIKSL